MEQGKAPVPRNRITVHSRLSDEQDKTQKSNVTTHAAVLPASSDPSDGNVAGWRAGKKVYRQSLPSTAGRVTAFDYSDNRSNLGNEKGTVSTTPRDQGRLRFDSSSHRRVGKKRTSGSVQHAVCLEMCI